MDLQEQDLSELLHVEAQHSQERRRRRRDGKGANDEDHNDSTTADDDDHGLNEVIEKSIQHFQDYSQNRARLARQNVSTYFAPSWCTPLECSVMWIAGCRPTTFIRLLYALIGEEIESRLEEFLQGRRAGSLGDASPKQMNLINSLHCKTIREEDKLSARLASLQEDMADNPISVIARQGRRCRHRQPAGKEVDEALEKHARSMLTVMEDADVLRLNTLKELISILTPVQGVNYLAASKKLHLCIHEWSGGGARGDHHQSCTRVPEHPPAEIGRAHV